ncbi:MAG: hypothetical protein U1B80_01585, partial [Anaerolineaceae bacterium]|nr:hypothetical protein [Anaerolineaceae bacterium]
MRITRELLLKLARTTAANRLLANRSVLCVYLTGSLLDDEPLLGGTADIDLIFIHDSQPPAAREVERISNEVHLDIAHLSQENFQHTRRLRTDPWFGSFLCASPIVLHDTHHWFDFIQASVCSQFHDPEYVVRR